MRHEIHRDEMSVIHHDETKAILELEWLESTARAAEADIKKALVGFAQQAEKTRARFLLIDVHEFRFRWTPELDAWRKQNILPRYGSAGVAKFAFLHPAGAAPPLAPAAEPGATFPTAHFDSRERAEQWFGSPS